MNRREFLKASVVVGTVAAAPGLSQAARALAPLATDLKAELQWNNLSQCYNYVFSYLDAEGRRWYTVLDLESQAFEHPDQLQRLLANRLASTHGGVADDYVVFLNAEAECWPQFFRVS